MYLLKHVVFKNGPDWVEELRMKSLLSAFGLARELGKRDDYLMARGQLAVYRAMKSVQPKPFVVVQSKQRIIYVSKIV